MKRFTFIFLLSLVAFSFKAFCDTYTLRVMEVSADTLAEYANLKSVKIPQQLTPKQFENISDKISSEFQIILNDGIKTSISEILSGSDNKTSWAIEKNREVKIDKICGDKFRLEIKFQESHTPQDPQKTDKKFFRKKTADFCACINLKVNEPVLICNTQTDFNVLEKTFLLGDIPLLGRLFQSNSVSTSKSYLLAILSEDENSSKESKK